MKPVHIAQFRYFMHDKLEQIFLNDGYKFGLFNKHFLKTLEIILKYTDKLSVFLITDARFKKDLSVFEFIIVKDKVLNHSNYKFDRTHLIPILHQPVLENVEAFKVSFGLDENGVFSLEEISLK